MKKPSKKTLIIIIATVLVIAVIAAALCIYFAPGDFRRAKWGMSMEQVKSRENLELVTEESFRLGYQLPSYEKITIDAPVFYNFSSETGKLTSVSLGFVSSGLEDKAYLRLVRIFNDAYGDPTESSEASTSNYHTWKTERTQIDLKQLETYTLITFRDINTVEAE